MRATAERNISTVVDRYYRTTCEPLIMKVRSGVKSTGKKSVLVGGVLEILRVAAKFKVQSAWARSEDANEAAVTTEWHTVVARAM